MKEYADTYKVEVKFKMFLSCSALERLELAIYRPTDFSPRHVLAFLLVILDGFA